MKIEENLDICIYSNAQWAAHSKGKPGEQPIS
jgi:hypothetical protein